MAARHQDSGFTLVELALVMTIIGLLIGGVLKGEELVNNARVKRVIRDYQGVLAANQAFMDQYGQWPGDMANATTRIAGCGGATLAGNWCQNGNSNGHVGHNNQLSPPGPLTAWGADETGGPAGTNPKVAAHPDQVETSMYWKHLALTDLITSVSPSAPPADPAWGETHPSGPFPGGYHIIYITSACPPGADPALCVGADSLVGGHYLRVQARMGSAGTNPGSGSIRPRYAAAIDRAIDDGKPALGFVRSWGHPSGIAGGCSAVTGGMTTNPSSDYGESGIALCVMAFRFQ
jgi:prepilin-type N-terminal cleavage/methylation domain-containing protein